MIPVQQIHPDSQTFVGCGLELRMVFLYRNSEKKGPLNGFNAPNCEVNS